MDLSLTGRIGSLGVRPVEGGELRDQGVWRLGFRGLENLGFRV